jgi:hypothetical protein
MSHLEEFLHAFQKEMARQGVTPERLADRLQCTPENVSQFLGTYRRESILLSTAERFARALGCRVRIVLVRRGEP